MFLLPSTLVEIPPTQQTLLTWAAFSNFHLKLNSSIIGTPFINRREGFENIRKLSILFMWRYLLYNFS